MHFLFEKTEENNTIYLGIKYIVQFYAILKM